MQSLPNSFDLWLPFVPHSLSQWPRGLRRGSAATQLLGLRVRIPPGHGCLSLVNVVCCQVDVSALGVSLIQRSMSESECAHETWTDEKTLAH
jgi:hypothetical protein